MCIDNSSSLPIFSDEMKKGVTARQKAWNNRNKTLPRWVTNLFLSIQQGPSIEGTEILLRPTK